MLSRYWFNHGLMHLCSVGFVFWSMQSLVFLILLQPLSAMAMLSRFGVFFGVLFFSYFSVVLHYLSKQHLLWLVEVQKSGAQSGCVWFLELVAFFLILSAVFLVSLPFFFLWYGFSLQHIVVLAILWLLASPVLILACYLATLVALFVSNGVVLSLLIVTPWSIPVLLMLLSCVRALLMARFAWSHLSLLAGLCLSYGIGYFFVISRVVVLAYHQVRLGRS